MRDNSIKKTIIKTAYFIVVFIVSVLIIGKLSNSEHADMTAKMPAATLPIVTITEGNMDLNAMHGYLSDVNVSSLRGTIVPVGMDRSLSFKVNTFGEDVTDIGYEVRSIDGKGLVENNMLTDYKEDSDTVYANIQLKDLIMPGREYMLVVFMNTPSGKAKYYTRFVWTDEETRYHMEDEIRFVLGFSYATFDKEKAEMYKTYLEPSKEGDNTSFANVNIHSSFNQVTWGDLEITKHSEPEICVTDIHGETGCYELRYRISIKDGSNTKNYDVTEDFRVRYTSERVRLLDYERHMNYIFDSGSSSLSPDSIQLGITDPNLEFEESDSGSAFAFVSENRLYAFNNTENKLVYLFGFYDTANDDIRTRWNRHSIKILSVDEACNVKFAVSGYMNRGFHEGHTGIAVYDYNSTINAVEEQAFIESNQAPEVVSSYVDKLAYASSNDIFYVMQDQDVYEIDLLDRTAKAVVEDIGTGSYKIAESESVIAWQGEDLTSLNVMNLNTRAMSEVMAADGEYIIALGFMGENLMYGTVRPDDIQNDNMGNPIYPMYSVKIQDSEGNVLEDYHHDGVYVTGLVSIVGNQIKVARVQKDPETGGYASTYDDVIYENREDEDGHNVITVASIDVYEKITQISTKNEIKVKQVRVLTPDQTLYEGDRNVPVESDRDIEANPFYYVHGISGDVKIYTTAADAVKEAERISGTVVNDKNNYVWFKGNRLKSNQIMAITRSAEAYDDMTSKSSAAVCIDLVLGFEGANRNVEALLARGDSVGQILEDALPEADILKLDGCSLSSILYYVNQDIPVLAMLNDGEALLVIGFNDQNTVLVNPKTGSVYKYGMNDSAKLFEENGNHFITYLREEK